MSERLTNEWLAEFARLRGDFDAKRMAIELIERRAQDELRGAALLYAEIGDDLSRDTPGMDATKAEEAEHDAFLRFQRAKAELCRAAREGAVESAVGGSRAVSPSQGSVGDAGSSPLRTAPSPLREPTVCTSPLHAAAVALAEAYHTWDQASGGCQRALAQGPLDEAAEAFRALRAPAAEQQPDVSKLARCPFCNSAWITCQPGAMYIDRPRTVECECGAKVGPFQTRAEAYAAWNRRAISAGVIAAARAGR